MSKQTPMVDIIIPTYNNYQMLGQCLNSLVNVLSPEGMAHIIVVNNGDAPLKDSIRLGRSGTIIDVGENIGWEGGLKKGLEISTAPFVMFLNDDTYFPISSMHFMQKLLYHFRHACVGAVGPASNVVCGMQNMFNPVKGFVLDVSYLIGFCMIVRREALDKVGGVDDILPGGDDIDLSIRLKDAGYTLLACHDVFVYHHGFQTGQRVHGSEWNSQDMIEKTDFALIRKHGFKKYLECRWGIGNKIFNTTTVLPDVEGDAVRRIVKKGEAIIDVGCGGKKTVEESIGVDMIPRGELIKTLNLNVISVADVCANLTERLPFEDKSADVIIARHIMEHFVDPIPVLIEFKRILRDTGKLIICVPDSRKTDSIPMCIEHVHAFNKESLDSLLNVTGFKNVFYEDIPNNISLMSVFQKEQH